MAVDTARATAVIDTQLATHSRLETDLGLRTNQWF